MGPAEIFMIFVVYLILFGSKGIPSLAQNMGKAVRTFRDASQDIQREILSSANEIKQEATRSVSEVRDMHETKAKTPPPAPPAGPMDQPQADQPADQNPKTD